MRVVHNASLATTIGGTVQKESDDLYILGVTFDFEMSFEKTLRPVFRAASQRLGRLRMSWRVFHDGSLLGRCFRGFVLPGLEYCSAVWCSTAGTHLKLLNRVVSGARFLKEWVFECDIAHRRSVVVLCMLYKIRCNPMHPYYSVLPGPHVPVQIIHAVLWSHIGILNYSIPRCRTSQYRRNFSPLSLYLCNDLADPLYDGLLLAGFKSSANDFY